MHQASATSRGGDVPPPLWTPPQLFHLHIIPRTPKRQEWEVNGDRTLKFLSGQPIGRGTGDSGELQERPDSRKNPFYFLLNFFYWQAGHYILANHPFQF